VTRRGRAEFAQGPAFPLRPPIPIVAAESTVLAETLALLLSITSTATPRAQPGIEVPDNSARARRGLLPRKVVRPRSPARGRRMVLRPQAPTWLGEPAAPGEPAPDGVLELAVDTAAEPVVARIEPVVAAGVPDETPEAVRASLQGADVELLLIRRLAEPEGAAVEVTVGEPELQVVVVRRRADREP
jgi:hypothetical protein